MVLGARQEARIIQEADTNVEKNPQEEKNSTEKILQKNIDSNIDERAMESLNNLKQLNKKLPEDENNPLRGKFSRIITGIVGSYNEEIKKVTGENEKNSLDRNENRNKDTKESDKSPLYANGGDSGNFEMVGEQTNTENRNEVILNAREVKREIKNMKKVLKKGKEEHKKILEKIIIDKNDDIQEIINSEKIDSNEKAD